jgi:hypothetical protein
MDVNASANIVEAQINVEDGAPSISLSYHQPISR